MTGDHGVVVEIQSTLSLPGYTPCSGFWIYFLPCGPLFNTVRRHRTLQ